MAEANMSPKEWERWEVIKLISDNLWESQVNKLLAGVKKWGFLGKVNLPGIEVWLVSINKHKKGEKKEV